MCHKKIKFPWHHIIQRWYVIDDFTSQVLEHFRYFSVDNFHSFFPWHSWWRMFILCRPVTSGYFLTVSVQVPLRRDPLSPSGGDAQRAPGSRSRWNCRAFLARRLELQPLSARVSDEVSRIQNTARVQARRPPRCRHRRFYQGGDKGIQHFIFFFVTFCHVCLPCVICTVCPSVSLSQWCIKASTTFSRKRAARGFRFVRIKLCDDSNRGQIFKLQKMAAVLFFIVPVFFCFKKLCNFFFREAVLNFRRHFLKHCNLAYPQRKDVKWNY